MKRIASGFFEAGTCWISPTQLSSAGTPFGLGFIIAVITLTRVAQAGDLPSTIRTLRQENNLIATTRLFRAACSDDECVTDSRAPQVGSLLQLESDGTYQIVCKSVADGRGSFALKPPGKTSPTFPMSYQTKNLRQLFEGLPRAEDAAEGVQRILEDATIEAREIYSELVIGDRDLRRAMGGLARDCARQAPAKSRIVLERRFGTITLRGTIKQNIPFSEFRSSLLELNQLLGSAYEAKIGSEGENRVLQISTRSPQLFLLRAVPWGDVQKHHPDWVDQIPDR